MRDLRLVDEVSAGRTEAARATSGSGRRPGGLVVNGEVIRMWREMIQGWIDLGREILWLIYGLVVVAGSALVMFVIQTRGSSG